MATPIKIDIKKLSAALSEEAPVGVDLRQDNSLESPFRSLKDARGQARIAEKALAQQDSEEKRQEMDHAWHQVQALAEQILTEKSKDIEVLTWYIESQLRFNGIAGLRDGFLLAKEIINQYWGQLYPQPEEDEDYSDEGYYDVKSGVCLAAFSGLNGIGYEGTLMVPIRNIAITGDQDGVPYSYSQYYQALEADKIENEKNKTKRLESLGFTLSDIEDTVANTDDEFYLHLKQDITGAMEAFSQLSKLLDEKASKDAPPISTIKKSLESLLGAVNHIAKEKIELLEAMEQDQQEQQETQEHSQTDEQGAAENPGVATASPVGVIKNRDDAFKELLKIAKFFQKNEPHSFLSGALIRIVKWGRMPLEELINELIPEANSRDHFALLTGVTPNSILEEDKNKAKTTKK